MTPTFAIPRRAVIEDARRRQRRRRVVTGSLLLLCLALGLVLLLRPSPPGSGPPGVASSAPAHRADGRQDAKPIRSVACAGPQHRIAVSPPAKGDHSDLVVRPVILSLTQAVLHHLPGGRVVGLCLYPVPARG
jgi:hypothetical protein